MILVSLSCVLHFLLFCISCRYNADKSAIKTEVVPLVISTENVGHLTLPTSPDTLAEMSVLPSGYMGAVRVREAASSGQG